MKINKMLLPHIYISFECDGALIMVWFDHSFSRHRLQQQQQREQKRKEKKIKK